MPSASVIPDELLEPVSAEKPAGEDLTGTALWVKIRDARPNPYDSGDKGNWARADGANASWALLSEMASSALKERSKDLRLALWLTEAAIKEHGFAGVRDGLRTIRELMARYWDSGLLPVVVDGDLETRSGPLEWLNEKLADAVREIPITLRAAPAANYSHRFYQESRRPGGAISAEEFDAAVAAGSREKYEALYAVLQEARAELQEFEQVAEAKFGPDGLSLTEAKEAFAECGMTLENILRKKRAAEPDTPAGGANGTGDQHDSAVPSGGLSFLSALSGSGASGSWAAAERLAQEGQTDKALAEMGRLAGSEPNGRVRFQRKLLLADICIRTGRQKLARPILEELTELIDKHQLEHWETAEVVGAVWTRLYRLYRGDQAGGPEPEKAAQLFLRLCRLDPWQALGCGDGR